jgi:hypothetical protein
LNAETGEVEIGGHGQPCHQVAAGVTGPWRCSSSCRAL